MADFKFSCPFCDRHLQAEPQWAGLVIKCPDCNNPITIPTPETAVLKPYPDAPAAAPGNPAVHATYPVSGIPNTPPPAVPDTPAAVPVKDTAPMPPAPGIEKPVSLQIPTAQVVTAPANFTAPQARPVEVPPQVAPVAPVEVKPEVAPAPVVPPPVAPVEVKPEVAPAPVVPPPAAPVEVKPEVAPAPVVPPPVAPVEVKPEVAPAPVVPPPVEVKPEVAPAPIVPPPAAPVEVKPEVAPAPVVPPPVAPVEVKPEVAPAPIAPTPAPEVKIDAAAVTTPAAENVTVQTVVIEKSASAGGGTFVVSLGVFLLGLVIYVVNMLPLLRRMIAAKWQMKKVLADYAVSEKAGFFKHLIASEGLSERNAYICWGCMLLVVFVTWLLGGIAIRKKFSLWFLAFLGLLIAMLGSSLTDFIIQIVHTKF